MQDVIVVQGLSKQFRRYHAHKPATLKEAALKGLRGLRGMQPVETFWALQDVSFSVAPGRIVGLIGRNGAGKSTLLRLIGGVGLPDRGKVTVRGHIGALLDLGAGFHPDLTGRENVFVNGVISGLTRRQVRRYFDSIVAFAELEKFIDNPLRTYSTGMQMRLGFAIAVHTSPDILLIDEVLVVGDLSFQRKCIERIVQFKNDGCAIVLVSHDEGQIEQLCDEVLWLRSGQLVAHGDAKVVIGQYVSEMTEETRRRTPLGKPALRTPTGAELRLNENRFGSLEMEITTVNLFSVEGSSTKSIDSGNPLRIEIEYDAPQPIASPHFVVTITREDQLVCYDTNTSAMGQTIPTLQGPGKITLHLERLDLCSGQYYVNVGVYESDWTYAYDYHWHVYPLLVRQFGFEKGVVCPPNWWEINPASVPSLKGQSY